MKKAVILAGAMFMGTSFAAVAADAGDTYATVGANLWDVSVDTSFGSGSVDPRGIEGRYGYFFSPNFAIEGRVGFGVSDDMGIEISRNFGVYFRGVLDANDNFQPYVLFGYTDLEIEVGSVSESDNDFSFGVGASIGSGDTKFNVEWARLYSDSAGGDSIDIDALNIGVMFSF